MQFAIKTMALVAALASSTFAFDVYSQFYESSGTEITSTSFDVANGGCFSVTPAETITFTQHDTTGEADGPYCLRAFGGSGCKGSEVTQEFSNVLTDGSTHYILKNGVADAASFSWDPASCP